MNPIRSVSTVIAVAFLLIGCTEPAAPSATNTAPNATQQIPTETSTSSSAVASQTWAKLPATGMDAAKPAGSCAIDIVNDAIADASTRLNSNDELSVSGWLAESTNNVPAHFKVILKGSDIYSLDASTGISRPDVAKVLGASDAENAGFKFETPLTSINAGTYQVLVLTSVGDTQEVCDTKHQFVIGN